MSTNSPAGTSTGAFTGAASTGAFTGAAFTPISFAPVEGTAPDGPGTPGYIRGHSIGYAFGMRAAEAESQTRRAEMEAEHAAGLLRLRAATEQGVATLNSAVAAVNAVVLPVVTEAQDALLAGSLELAEAVIGKELSDGEHSARAALTRAMTQRAAAGTYAVRMNPADLATLDADTLAGARVRLVPDTELAPGDAMAEFEYGYLDARIGTALARAKDALRGDSE
ncbi:FliH/SctL family protein [Arthrobacter sp. A5]|uniref:FliH/SctL family protein n=1 Tax=Arthrobacter sp. A5 TaxID=576926 RepID=UPI003DA961B0